MAETNSVINAFVEIVLLSSHQLMSLKHFHYFILILQPADRVHILDSQAMTSISDFIPISIYCVYFLPISPL